MALHGASAQLQINSLWQRGYGVLVRDFTWECSPGQLTVLTGATPAARWAVAALVADALPAERFAFTGRLTIDGRTSAHSQRSQVALAQPWRVRSAHTELDRRLVALQWAQRTERPLVVLNPGLDNLTDADAAAVLEQACTMSAQGTTMLLTARHRDQLARLPQLRELLTVADLDTARRDAAA